MSLRYSGWGGLRVGGVSGGARRSGWAASAGWEEASSLGWCVGVDVAAVGGAGSTVAVEDASSQFGGDAA